MGQDNKRPTLKTIADLTGYAIPTVSRALNGSDEIGAETCARIRKVAAEIGYVPNRAGVRLRTGRSYVISLMLSADTETLNFTASLINTIAADLQGTRYNLTINPYFNDEEPLQAVRRIVETHAADALILNQTTPDDPRVEYLLKHRFPFVTHGRTRWSAQHDFYDFDNHALAGIGVDALVARGRKNFLLIAPPADQNYAQDMIQGFRERCETLQLNHDVATGISSDDPGKLIREYLRTRLEKGARFDGVICGSAFCCLEAVASFEAAGYTISKEFDIFSKEVKPLLTHFRQEILTSHEDPAIAGRFLAQTTLARLERPDTPLMQLVERPNGLYGSCEA